MVSKCVNQSCAQQWEFSVIGVVYALESGPDACLRRPTEFFWLCPACMTRRLVVCKDAQGQVVALPRGQAPRSTQPDRGGDLRVVFHPRALPSKVASSNLEGMAFRNLRRNARRAYLPDAA
ncbi:MAG: hypothetical protein ACYCSN_04195 [Acidobacteriaceae bacterium]